VSRSAGQWAARATAVLLGLVFVASVVTGRSGLLVRPWFDVVLVGTGVVILIVAWNGVPSLSPAAMFLLLLPIAVALSVTPKVAGRISAGSNDLTGLGSRIGDSANPLARGRGGNVNLLQIRLAEQQVGSVYLSGRPVTVEARVTGPREVGRPAIVCCAADARLITLPVTGAKLPKKDSWVRLSGKLQARGTETVLHVAKVEPIKTPSEPFM
jgi:hypothetical protein